MGRVTVSETLQQELTAATAESPDAVLSVNLARVRDSATLFAANPEALHYAASTMKLPLVTAAYRQAERGVLDLQGPIRVHNSFGSRVGGTFSVEEEDDSDPQVWAEMGNEVTLEWLCRRTIVRSSNLATNLVIEAVGFDPVAEVLQDAGADGVTVVRKIGDYVADDQEFRNRITSAGLTTMLVALANHTVAPEPVCEAVLDVLAANEIDTDVRGGLPANTYVAHKNGWVTGIVHDTALVRPDDAETFVLTVATTTDWDEERAHAFIRRIAGLVWAERSSLAGAGQA